MEKNEKGQKDPDYRLKMLRRPEQVRRTKGPRYTPVSKRQDKPDGIAWILRNHPEISDGAISKLIGTTRTTITAIPDRSHWTARKSTRLNSSHYYAYRIPFSARTKTKQ